MICIDHITYYTYKRFSGKTISNMSVKQKFYLLISGPGPIDILQRKFYTTLIFKHSDWLLKFVNQSGCLKI